MSTGSQIRKINAPDNSGKIGSDQGPVTSAFHQGGARQGAQLFNWDEKKKLSGQRTGNKVIGIGIGQGYHSAGTNGFDGLVRITPDGKLHVHTGVGNLGTYSHSATAPGRRRIPELQLGQRDHRARRQPARPALEQRPGGQPDGIDPIAHQLCRGHRCQGEAPRHRGPDARRRARRLRPRRRERRPQIRPVEIDHAMRRRRRRRSNSAANTAARRCRTTSTRSPRTAVQMIAGTGTDRRRQGQPAAHRRHARA